MWTLAPTLTSPAEAIVLVGVALGLAAGLGLFLLSVRRDK